MSQYITWGMPAILGLTLAFLFRTDWWQTADSGKWYEFWTFLYGNTAMAWVYMFLGLAVTGAIVAVVSIKWRVFFMYLAAGFTVLGLSFATDWNVERDIPFLLTLSALPFLVVTEADRLSHEYHLTNLRILFKGGTFIRKERQLKFEAITDLDGSQGPIARIFNYGTLIPVTQSGFGLGADTSQAQIMVGGGAEKGGIMGGAAVAAGGGKEVQVGRARTFHQLTGIKPYGDTKYLLEKLIQEATSTPYLRQQVELQRQMLGAMQRMAPNQSDEPPLYEGQRFE